MRKKDEKPADPLDKFGKFLMVNLRDKGIENYDLVAKSHWKAPYLQQLQADLKKLTKDQKEIVRRCVVHSLDVALHDFLFALQELEDSESDIHVVVDGKNIAALSDGLQGELFTEEGWRAKFSAYGEPPETA